MRQFRGQIDEVPTAVTATVRQTYRRSDAPQNSHYPVVSERPFQTIPSRKSDGLRTGVGKISSAFSVCLAISLSKRIIFNCLFHLIVLPSLHNRSILCSIVLSLNIAKDILPIFELWPPEEVYATMLWPSTPSSHLSYPSHPIPSLACFHTLIYGRRKGPRGGRSPCASTARTRSSVRSSGLRCSLSEEDPESVKSVENDQTSIVFGRIILITN